MSILYLKDHCACFNYSKDPQALIRKHVVSKGDTWEMNPLENTLLILTEGSITASFGKYENQNLQKGKIILLTSNTPFKATAKKDTQIFAFKIPSNVQLCDRYSLEQLLKETNNEEPDLHYLDMNGAMAEFLRMLDVYIAEGLKCVLFFDMKIKELFFLFRGFYTKEQLYMFFYPILSNDLTFSDFVYRNYSKVKTVTELAELANYSRSGFVKRFKKVFGVSAYQWMREQKANVIYHEINDMKKALKEISFEYGFSSPAHFNDFCKTHFGNTPGNIRKTKLNKQEQSIN